MPCARLRKADYPFARNPLQRVPPKGVLMPERFAPTVSPHGFNARQWLLWRSRLLRGASWRMRNRSRETDCESDGHGLYRADGAMRARMEII
jgi:hypothetical protein